MDLETGLIKRERGVEGFGEFSCAGDASPLDALSVADYLRFRYLR
jgi:hypothetical protein